MKSLVLSLFLCSWITAAAFANGSIRGKVTDASNGKPLVGASVYLHELRTGTVTGADGTYQTAEIPSGTYLMEVSFMGYSSFLKTVRVDKSQEINVVLKPSVVEHEAVTVTGVASAIRLSQNPQAISVVKKTDLQRSSGTNIIDALSRIVPGVGALSTGPAVSKPIIRGLGYNRVITINDGVRQEGQQWGDEHGIEIDEASVQRVEILKGPASLLYGSDGMGGVINIISNVPVERGIMKANYHVATNSNNGLLSNHLNWSGHALNGFNWNLYGSFKNTSFWSSSDMRSLSEDARALALYLLTCPHGTIAGVFRLPDGYACEDLQWCSERVSEGFSELFAKGFANRCETTKWVWIRKHFEWNSPENPNQKKS